MKEIIAKILEIIKIIFEFLFSKTSENIEMPEEKYEEPAVEQEKEDIPEYKEEEVNIEEIPITALPEEDIKHHIINDEFTEEDMFFFFVNCGMNYYGAAGLMGNLYAESGLRSNNLQNTYSKKFGMSDEEYTTAVDNGTYQNFVNDSAGYGIAQWTFWSRKHNLLDYAISTERSIGDLMMQCEFLIQELKSSYKSVWDTLCNATSVSDASNSVLLKFERPANQSEENQARRASFGQKYYDKYFVV